jgi:predicted murein hydrolase (TIGR00659 family)
MDKLLFLIMTVAVFVFCGRLYIRYRTPLLLPVLTSTVIISVVLVSFSLDYDRYYSGARWLSELLGPAVVALAYPLYSCRVILFNNWRSILSGVLIGFLIGFLSVYVFAVLLSVNETAMISLYSKSVTTPVAMELTAAAGGSPRLASLFVMVTGILGSVLAPSVFKAAKITSEAAKGIALGSSSHAIGTSKAIEYGEEAAAYSSVSLAVSCFAASVWIPLWMLFVH